MSTKLSSKGQNPLFNVRNMGIFAHVDAGKTTTTERVLYYAGKKHNIGDVDEGNTTTDFMKQEQERGITIQSAAVSCSWNGKSINLIDTPGHIDFTMEVERSMRVLDGGVLVLCAKGGVQPQTRTVSRQATRHHVPRLTFINKMDTMGADFYRVVSQIVSELKIKPAIIQLPIGQAETFVGVIDLLTMKAHIWDNSDDTGATFSTEEIPADMAAKAAEYRKNLVEVICEGDDALLEKYLSDEAISVDELKVALRQATTELRLFPILCGSAFKKKGVQQLLDAVVDYLPSPLEVPAVKGVLSDGSEGERQTSDSEPLAALAFKVTTDAHGNLTFVRVYSGVLKAGTAVYNSVKDAKERVSRLVKLQGNKREEVTELHAGDIGAVIGLKSTTTGDTLCSEEQSIKLESITCPEPVISMAIEAKDHAGNAKLGEALTKLALEDPSFRRRTDSETAQTIIAGQGKLHLDVKVRMLEEDFGVPVTVGQPQVSYREAIRAKATGVGKHVKQSGGHGQYGHAVIEMEPLPKGSGFEFVDAVVGGSIPREFIGSVEKGVRSMLDEGALAGFPVIDVRVTLVEGSSHDVDSSDMAFQLAGRLAFKDAFMKAKPVLLEPIMQLVVEVPEKYQGNVIGDVSQLRGKITGMDSNDGTAIISATVPLERSYNYSDTLRSNTQGQGSFTLEFASYEQVPNEVAEEIISKAKK